MGFSLDESDDGGGDRLRSSKECVKGLEGDEAGWLYGARKGTSRGVSNDECLLPKLVWRGGCEGRPGRSVRSADGCGFAVTGNSISVCVTEGIIAIMK